LPQCVSDLVSTLQAMVHYVYVADKVWLFCQVYGNIFDTLLISSCADGA